MDSYRGGGPRGIANTLYTLHSAASMADRLRSSDGLSKRFILRNLVIKDLHQFGESHVKGGRVESEVSTQL